MVDFNAFGLPELLCQRLQSLGFNAPTPIQQQAIPEALAGHDILGSADTGTGKTAAFGIPLIAKLLSDDSTCGLIITPTRELATQVMKSLALFIDRKAQIHTSLLIGGEPIDRQLKALKKYPRLIVGTPGRINDHLKRGSLKLSTVNYVVLDETDRMLDMGFVDQINSILEQTSSDRQTLLFSATLPKSILKLAESFMTDPKRIAVESTLDTSKLQHEIIRLAGDDKRTKLTELLRDRLGSVILFVKTKYGSEKMAKFLQNAGFTSDALHGDLKHSRRERVTKNFRNQKFQILVATDVAARGLDISHIEHVINFELPQCPEDYIHRIGRTARAGREGEAISFVTPSDRRTWGIIAKLMNLEDDAGFGFAEDDTSRERKGQRKGYRGNSRGDSRSYSGKGQPNRRNVRIRDGLKTKNRPSGRKDHGEANSNDRSKPDRQKSHSGKRPENKRFENKRPAASGPKSRGNAKPSNGNFSGQGSGKDSGQNSGKKRFGNKAKPDFKSRGKPRTQGHAGKKAGFGKGRTPRRGAKAA